MHDRTEALVLVDLQRDFLPGGALEVPGGDEVIPVVNHVARRFERVIATQDWHPPDHGSFASRHPGHEIGEVIEFHGLDQILWPDHCVQNTPGAAMADHLDTDVIEKVFRKGTDPKVDSYSGFFDNGHRVATGLGDYLRHQGVRTVYIAGLATDYCVKYSALDSAELGFETYVIVDGCRGVDLHEGDVDKALDEMRRKGVHTVHSDEV